MPEIREEELNSLRSQADIAEVVGHYLPLVKKGKALSAVCPFHDDHDPSLNINTDRQIYKCFVCGAGGNVFTFVRDYEKISFREAVIKVADMVGFKLSAELSIETQSVDPAIQRLYSCLKDGVQFTHYNLNTINASDAKSYLKNRGINDAIIDKFELGYNPDNDELTKFLKAKGHSTEDLVKSNLTRINEFGEKDVFAGRITFPIHDPQGRPVGFSARALQKDLAKYVNTAETPIYSKGRLLYNYHRAKTACRQAGETLLVEGVTDVLAFDKAGVYNVLATLGTACTKDQIRLIRQISEKVVLCYDGDTAGQSATYKIGTGLLEAGFKLEVISNDTGLDPDEICQKHGAETLAAFSRKRVSWLDFLIEYRLKSVDLNNYSQKKEFVRVMMNEIAKVNDRFDREMLVQRLSTLTKLTAEQMGLLAPRTTTTPSESQLRKSPVLAPRLSKLEWAEKEILGQMLTGRLAALQFRDELGFLPDRLNNALAMTILDYYRNHSEILLADFINTLGDGALVSLVTEISNNEIYYKEYNQRALRDALTHCKASMLDHQIDQLKTEAKKTDDLVKRQSYAKQLEDLRNEKLRLKEQKKED
ncbi:MAG: DNA primase [Firmicutes bacterium GWF2_51_9]|nr:MAG: DNA primase [Firmicutes bacterium GWF2_51_9]OGS59113.1 MAG: DNA primase [Firmicutes bacterium GWE2_51_13]HBZ41214.1 DNA primase [Erysipelotrichaceae bacterium]